MLATRLLSVQKLITNPLDRCTVTQAKRLHKALLLGEGIDELRLEVVYHGLAVLRIIPEGEVAQLVGAIKDLRAQADEKVFDEALKKVEERGFCLH